MRSPRLLRKPVIGLRGAADDDPERRAFKGRLNMAGDVITLAEMRAKGMTLLEVACCRCEHRGRLRIERLSAEHGDGLLDLRHHRRRLSLYAEPLGMYGRCGRALV